MKRKNKIKSTINDLDTNISKYLVEQGLARLDRERLKESAIIINSSLMDE